MELTVAKALRLRRRAGQGTTTTRSESASVAFVGAGGKSTSIFNLARELGPATLITTTTHLGTWQAQLADRHVIARSPTDLEGLDASCVTLVTGAPEPDSRLSSVTPAVLASLRQLALSGQRDLLIEADGARQRPLKAPLATEPQIPDFVETVVVVAGLQGLGTELSDNMVHRPQIFGALSGLKAGELITPEAVVRVLADSHGGLQGVPSTARRIALLNGADSTELQWRAHVMADPLLQSYETVVVASARDRRIFAAYEQCAAIILAAGGATRFGGPKQLAPWHGEPLARLAARIALEAGLTPVIVVTGAHAEKVRQALEGLPVHSVENVMWRTGQGSSVSCGMAAVPRSSGAAVFLLADQPLVTPAVIRALVELHATEDACIVAPLVEDGKRANPVLFDRETFGRLRSLQGDVGGRSLFNELPVTYVPWHDPGIVRDIDTRGDYQDLLESGK